MIAASHARQADRSTTASKDVSRYEKNGRPCGHGSANNVSTPTFRIGVQGSLGVPRLRYGRNERVTTRHRREASRARCER